MLEDVFEMLMNKNEICPSCRGDCGKLINKKTHEIRCVCGHSYKYPTKKQGTMIITNKQLQQMIYLLSLIVGAADDCVVGGKFKQTAEKLLIEIINQQSEELKVLE